MNDERRKELQRVVADSRNQLNILKEDEAVAQYFESLCDVMELESPDYVFRIGRSSAKMYRRRRSGELDDLYVPGGSTALTALHAELLEYVRPAIMAVLQRHKQLAVARRDTRLCAACSVPDDAVPDGRELRGVRIRKQEEST